MSSADPARSRTPVPRPRGLTPVALRRLRPDLPAEDASAELTVTGVTADSRLVQPGDLYVALPGGSRHGAEFATGAVADGAVAVLTDPSAAARLADLGRPVLVVPEPRAALAGLAAEIYGRPAERLRMLGITGTNGKTTTSFLAAAALQAAGLSVGVVGTLGFSLDGAELPAPRNTVTTPDAPELQALLAVLAERGADAVVMEVSSHALALGRTDAVVFDVAAFTNFGRDHLDFHGDEESYFEAKARLFRREHSRAAVLNVDDPRGRQLLERVEGDGILAATTVSLTEATADFGVDTVRVGANGASRVTARTPYGPLELGVGLPGDFNIRNALTALAMADRIGVGVAAAARGLADAQVPGRMERVDLGPAAPTVLVDFAHTPQAVAAVLGAVAGRRRIVVLGCGGDRDQAKREPMGAAATAADLVVVTDDNPRSEDPAAIRAAVLAGARAAQGSAGHPVDVVDGGNRRAAIRLALSAARPGDVVAVLGKGHETGQEIAGQVLPFRDVDVVREEWAASASSATVGR